MVGVEALSATHVESMDTRLPSAPTSKAMVEEINAR